MVMRAKVVMIIMYIFGSWPHIQPASSAHRPLPLTVTHHQWTSRQRGRSVSVSGSWWGVTREQLQTGERTVYNQLIKLSRHPSVRSAAPLWTWWHMGKSPHIPKVIALCLLVENTLNPSGGGSPFSPCNPFVPPLLPPSAPQPENLLFRHRLNSYPFMQLLPWGQTSQHASSLCARPLTSRRWDVLYTNPSGLILAVKSRGVFFKWQLAACRQNRGDMLAIETMASPRNLLCSNHRTTNQTCLCLPL